MGTIPNLKPGDLVETKLRLYHVAGVHLGALGQESIVQLVPLDATRPDMHGKTMHPLVPTHMLAALFAAGLLTVTPIE